MPENIERIKKFLKTNEKDTDNGEVTSYTDLYFEKLMGICVDKDKKIETKDINALRPVVINIAEQYKNLLIIQKKEEIKKDFV